MARIEITPSEWEVIRVLWANGELGSSDIVAVLQKKRGWKPTTTKTLLSRLVTKGYIETKSVGNRYLYRPLISERDAWDDAAKALFSFICARDRGQKLARLIEANALSEEDITLLEATLERAKMESVKEVRCDCFKGQCCCHLAVKSDF